MMPDNVSRRNVLKAAGGAAALIGVGGLASADGNVTVNVGFTNEQGRTAALDAAADVKREFDAIDVVAIDVAPEAVEGLANNPNVRYVEADGRMHAEQTTPYGIELTKADETIDDGYTGDGVSIGIIDTGIDPNHETLAENLGEGWAATSAVCQDDCDSDLFCSANEIRTCYEEWDDDHDHGTHVAGTAAAADNGEGVLGVAPEATLHAVKVLDCCGGGDFSDIAAGIEWSAQQGHDVINMSLGGDESDAVNDALDYAAQQGVVLVGSAGNEGEDDSVTPPGTHPEVITVSATDENDELADFSSRGEEVDIAAPGADVLSSVARDDYAEFSGTSMSAPHVAGAAAQVIASGVTDREEVRSALEDSADDIGLDDDEQGAGRLNLAAALDVDDDDDDDDDDDPELAVSTESPTDVGETSATLNGELTELEGYDDADVSFEWGETGDGLANTTDAETLSATGAFDEELSGLDADTDYEFRAVAETDDDSAVGDTLTFTTGDEEDPDEDPVIDQFDVNRRTSGPWSRADVNWEVSDPDGALDEVVSELLDADGNVLDDESSNVSGSSASGEHNLRTRDGPDPDEVRLTVTDETGNSTSETKDY